MRPAGPGQELAVPAARPPSAARSGWRAWRLTWSHPAVLSCLVTAAGAALWVTVVPRVGTDLSAAIARAGWAGRYPDSAYIFSWYGGIHPAGYSLLAPYLLAIAGTRLAMAVAAVISAGLLALLLVRHRVPRPLAGSMWGAVALCTELTAGRAAFTLAIAAALGCVVMADAGRAAGWPRLLSAAGLAQLTGLLSPVAALFLGIVAVAFALTGRWARGLVIGVAAALPLGAMALFSDGGVQPVTAASCVPPLLAVAGALVLIPRRWRMVRIGAIVYGLGILAACLVPTPVGSNVERLGELVAGPLLAGLGSSRHRWLLAGALVAVAGWQVAQPSADLAQGSAPPYSPQTAGLVHELRVLRADTARVEAVPQYGHWESQQLASVVPLARGWERQVDIERNPLFYHGTLTPSAYHAWLRYNAVRYVAISAAPPDFAAVAETDLVRAGQPWLVPVWHDAYWQLYRVTGTLPLASPPATVTGSTPALITLRMSRAGQAIVRVRWSPLLRASGTAVVRQHGAWTSLTVRRRGSYTLSAPY